MRTALTLLFAIVTVSLASAQQPTETYAPKNGKFSVKFPGPPSEKMQSAKTGGGDLGVFTATFATVEGNVYLVSYTDFPAGTVKAETVGTLYDGVREGLKKDGKLISEKDLTLGGDKLSGREIVVEKGKQQLRFRVVARDNRLFQVAVVGSGDFVTGKDATAFLESFEVTK
jgi:hypothetical protein